MKKQKPKRRNEFAYELFFNKLYRQKVIKNKKKALELKRKKVDIGEFQPFFVV